MFRFSKTVWAGGLTRFPGEETFIVHGVAWDQRALRDLIIGTERTAPGDPRLRLPVRQEPLGAWIPSPFY